MTSPSSPALPPTSGVVVGVLAVQGDVREHIATIESLGVRATPVRRASELAGVDGLIIPGGILLGLIESLGAGYIGELTGGFLGSNYQDIFAFIVLIIVLTLRPSGLMGERVADRA